MEESGHRENGRHKPDQYKSAQAQWMMSHTQIKDYRTVNLMAATTQRDMAVQQRNQALSEKEAAFAERERAILSLNAAIADRNKAIMEREEAIRALESARKNGMTTNSSEHHGCPPRLNASRGIKSVFQHDSSQQQQQQQLSDAPCDHHPREVQITDATPISVVPESSPKVRRPKQPRKAAKLHASPTSKTPKPPRKSKKGGMDISREDLDRQMKHEWKDQNLGLNFVSFDDATMPPPVCSCTGTYRQCYKWGNGGWQSSCCTTTLSMFPLPISPNKRHSRVGGRKMSGSAFSKLLSRLAAEGHDLSMPLDLRDHWAKHGTNRYITIK